VKTTWKSVAEKDELVMHVSSELDSNMRIAEVVVRRDSIERSAAMGDVISERRIMSCVCKCIWVVFSGCRRKVV
jgi:hypothetical protein